MREPKHLLENRRQKVFLRRNTHPFRTFPAPYLRNTSRSRKFLLAPVTPCALRPEYRPFVGFDLSPAVPDRILYELTSAPFFTPSWAGVLPQDQTPRATCRSPQTIRKRLEEPPVQVPSNTPSRKRASCHTVSFRGGSPFILVAGSLVRIRSFFLEHATSEQTLPLLPAEDPRNSSNLAWETFFSIDFSQLVRAPILVYQSAFAYLDLPLGLRAEFSSPGVNHCPLLRVFWADLQRLVSPQPAFFRERHQRDLSPHGRIYHSPYLSFFPFVLDAYGYVRPRSGLLEN